jgi:hypothetical protein
MAFARHPRMWSMARKLCGVRWTSLWSMINGHATHIFVKNRHERPFSIIPKANTCGFLTKNGLHQKSKNMTYGKKPSVGWGVRASSQWSMATQPPFLSKIAWTTIFNNTEGWHQHIFHQEMVSTRNQRMWSMARKHMWGAMNEALVDD